MTKKEHTTKLVDEKSGLMECLVCGEKYHTTMKPGTDGKFLPENWECVNKCRLIHHDEKPAQKKNRPPELSVSSLLASHGQHPKDLIYLAGRVLSNTYL